jgi:hypothetical protein
LTPGIFEPTSTGAARGSDETNVGGPPSVATPLDCLGGMARRH